MAPNMQMTSASKELQHRSTTFARRILISPLSKHDAWIAYFAVLVPGLSYTLAVSHHKANHLRKIQSPSTRATLLKLGFCRNTALSIVYGPSRYGGLGFRDLPVEQGIAATQMLLRHLRAQTSTGSLITISLLWWQLVTGVSAPLLETHRT